ncbi:MAG: T9SS type A sorting domain-containing protein [Crocinitomicaceae bacterium]|nr:T9SS type A sorting domain-containing protein [Crocinitomicaceae bacterium]
MKVYILLLLFFGALSNSTFSQSIGDTITVSTFNYTQTYFGSGIRDSVIEFPSDSGVSYSKVLMSYNMRCKGAGVNTTGGNNVACGEWDYSCNTYLHDSSRVDSLISKHPDFTISGWTGNTYDYTLQATYDYFQHTLQEVAINSTTSETVGTLGAGVAVLDDVMSVQYESGKSQYLLTAAELQGSGLTAGDLTGLRLDITNGSSDVQFLRIRVKNTTASALDASATEMNGFTQVYFNNYVAAVGTEQFQFAAPFNWDGTSNIIVELNFTAGSTQSAIEFAGETAPVNSVLTSQVSDSYIKLDGTSAYLKAPGTTYDFSSGFTFSTWIRYDDFGSWSRILDFSNSNNTDNITLRSKSDSDGLYLIVDNSEIGLDNVLVLDEWTHIACTIDDAGNGVVYVNGQVVANGLMNIPPSIYREHLIIGSSLVTNPLINGYLDDVAMWNVGLTQAEIQGWMYKDIDATHPQYSSLLFSYNFNDQNTSQATDGSSMGVNANLINYVPSLLFDGRDIFKNLSNTLERPNISLLQGVYSQTISDVYVLDSVQLAPNAVSEYIIVSNTGTLESDQVNPIDTNYYWEAVDQNVYNAETGVLLSTIPVSVDGSITPLDLDYFNRWPMKFEIISFVTPYGINLNLGPEGKTWTFDVTDFLPILQGTKRMTMERGGQWQEDMDIKFHFIVGTAPRDVLDIQSIWRTESRGYTGIVADDYFAPRDVSLNATGDKFKIRTSVTGHGQEGEFIPRQHFVDIDGGSNEFAWEAWKECGENPVYPQGGTWVYDRAGWCPGMATDVQEFDITPLVTAGNTANIDYGIITASGSSNYIVSNQLVTYGEPNHTLDAELIEVQEPSNRVEFARFNSICHEPIVVIRNNGSEVLTTARIRYWINDESNAKNFMWTGNLGNLETERIELPTQTGLWNSMMPSGNIFYAEIVDPNGGIDEYEYNDLYTSPFEVPEVMPANLVVEFKTNNAPQESSYEILDAQGNVVLSRSNMAPSTFYQDTIHLGLGCYSYNVYDTDDDGISWWANNDGVGYTRFREEGVPGVIKSFGSDFGDNIHFNFTIDYPLSYDELNNLNTLEVYPNPTEDLVTISARGFDGIASVRIVDALGKIVYQSVIETAGGNYQGAIDIEHLDNGIYHVFVQDKNKEVKVKLVKQ